MDQNNSANIPTNILAIESSGNTCGIAISLDGELALEYSIYVQNLHDKLLAELIKRAMQDLSINFEMINAFAISNGPGSFTGLRIGSSLVKGLSFGKKVKLITVPTLQSFACASEEFARSMNAENIYVFVPTNGNNFYFQKFDNQSKALSDIEIISNDDANNFINSNSENAIFSGFGIKFPEERTLSGLQRLSPRFVLRLANRMYKQEMFTNVDTFVPEYVQDFVPKNK